MSSKHLATAAVAVGVTAATIMLGTCSGPVVPEVMAGLDACAECNMVIDTPKQACGHVAEGEFVPFDSPGCLLRAHDELRRRDLAIPTEVWLADFGTGEFVPAAQAALLLTEEIPTVMGAGVLCFATEAAARAHRSSGSEEITDWAGYRRHRGQPDIVLVAVVTPTAMEPEMLEVAKGDLVLLKLSSGDLDQTTTLTIRGYPEIGEIAVPPESEPVAVRFFANRPGAGFPITDDGDEPLGMMRVTGAHTDDEAAQ